MTLTHLIVQYRGGGRGERDGGDATDEISKVVAAFHFGVSGEGPYQTVDKVTGNILL